MGRSPPTILAFDTSAAHCAAAVLAGGRPVAARVEEMGRGQAERLFPMLEALLAEAGVAWTDLDAVGVGIGPGNFTGIRIAVSAARGLALSRGIPAIGVSRFDVYHRRLARAEPALLAVAAAPREAHYLQYFRDGQPDGTPFLLDADGLAGHAHRHDPAIPVAGENAGRVALALGRTGASAEAPEARELSFGDVPWGVAIAEIAAARLDSGATPPRPAPLYIRPADAAPPREAPPVMLP